MPGRPALNSGVSPGGSARAFRSPSRQGNALKSDQISGLFWGAIGLIAVLGALRLDLGNLGEPGPGLFAFSAGCFVCLLALVVFLRASLLGRGFQVSLSSLWEGVKWNRPVVVVLLMLGFILTLERLGFFLTSFLLLFVILKGVGKVSWKKGVLIPVSTLAISYLLFIFFLKVNLPKGPLGF